MKAFIAVVLILILAAVSYGVYQQHEKTSEAHQAAFEKCDAQSTAAEIANDEGDAAYQNIMRAQHSKNVLPSNDIRDTHKYRTAECMASEENKTVDTEFRSMSNLNEYGK